MEKSPRTREFGASTEPTVTADGVSYADVFMAAFLEADAEVGEFAESKGGAPAVSISQVQYRKLTLLPMALAAAVAGVVNRMLREQYRPKLQNVDALQRRLDAAEQRLSAVTKQVAALTRK